MALAEYLNAKSMDKEEDKLAQILCDLKIVRISRHNYIFGTRKVQIVMIKGKLGINIGATCLTLDEFAAQFGEREI